MDSYRRLELDWKLQGRTIQQLGHFATFQLFRFVTCHFCRRRAGIDNLHGQRLTFSFTDLVSFAGTCWYEAKDARSNQLIEK